jgi:hypothetical protein
VHTNYALDAVTSHLAASNKLKGTEHIEIITRKAIRSATSCFDVRDIDHITDLLCIAAPQTPSTIAADESILIVLIALLIHLDG